MKGLAIFATVALSAFAFAGCRHEARYVTVDGAMLGTTFHVVARTDRSPKEIYAGIMRIDGEAKASMSIFDEQSLLSRINANLTDSADCHILRNIAVASEIHRISGGMYDITVKPLTEAYGFAAKHATAQPDIDSLLQFVGMSRLHVEGNRIVKDDERVQLDLNSIAKGYTVDMVAEFLESKGVADYIVEIGGEIRARGINGKGRKWRVAIDAPFDGNDAPGAYMQTTVDVSDAALATSGNYRRFHTDSQGRKIAHTINPLTGESVCSRLLSATVVTRDCTTADALGTMFMALGEQRAIEMATQMRDSVRVYFILAPEHDADAEYEIFSTLDESTANDKPNTQNTDK